MSKKILLITAGEPAGIGPELIAKSLDRIFEKFTVIVVSNYQLIDFYIKKIKPNLSYKFNIISNISEIKKENINILDIFPPLQNFKPGKPNFSTSLNSFLYLKTSCELIKKNISKFLITSPISKSQWQSIGINFDGQTEFLKDFFRIKNVSMMLTACIFKNFLNTITITRHIPISKISKFLNPKEIYNQTILFYNFLKKRLNIKKPILGICGLNPHCGDNGVIGWEEQKIIIPAVRKINKSGVKVIGPLNTDVGFNLLKKNEINGLICMYHDQAIVPLKTLYPWKMINVTVGLPFIRVSPGHGTAFDIAGKMVARGSSFNSCVDFLEKIRPWGDSNSRPSAS